MSQRSENLPLLLFLMFLAGIAFGVYWGPRLSAPSPNASALASDSTSPLAPESLKIESVAEPESAEPEGDAQRLISSAARISPLRARLWNRAGEPSATLRLLPIGPEGRLLLPLTQLLGVTSLEVDGRRLDTLSALDERRAIGLFTLGRSGAQVSGEEHPLYLGRSIQLRQKGLSYSGWVDQTDLLLPERDLPLAVVQLEEGSAELGAVLRDPDSGELLGLIYRPLGEGRAAVIDATELRDLSDTPERRVALGAALEREAAQAPNLASAQFRDQLQRGDLNAALRLGAQLQQQNGFLEQQADLLALLTKEVRRRNRQNHPDQALRLLNQAESLLPENAPLQLLIAETHLRLEAWSEARARLMLAAQWDTHLLEEVQRLLRQVVAGELAAVEQHLLDLPSAVILLEEAIALEPESAHYREQLGDLLMRQGEYAAAADAFLRAMALDPRQERRLQRRLAEARLKRDNPPISEVAFAPRGSQILVDVYINDDPRPALMVLDTGASHTVLSYRYTEQRGILVPSDAPIAKVRTANRTTQARRIALSSVRLGEARVEYVPALVMDTLGAQIDGLLGLTYLSHFQVSIDHNRGVVELRLRD